jgi:hypothetical protein
VTYPHAALRVTWESDTAVVWLHGEQGPSLGEMLSDLLDSDSFGSLNDGSLNDGPLNDGSLNDAESIVIDLRNVTFIDSSTLRALVAAVEQHEQRPPPLSLRAPSACVVRMFGICGQDHLLAR